MSKWGKIAAGTVAAAFVAGIVIYNLPHFRNARFVDALVARNVEARGGAEAWESVEALRVSGQMDLGQGLAVPYTLEQKRPGRMCFEFDFADERATQCVNGDSGWKVAPFQNRRDPEPMTADELKGIADLADIDGLLFNYSDRGHDIEYVGEDVVDDRPAYKLHVRLPTGDERWVYLDQETALERMLESRRVMDGKMRAVFTRYEDWRDTNGILMPHYQDTVTEGREGSNFLTVESVTVNPVIEDARFVMPGAESEIRTASAQE